MDTDLHNIRIGEKVTNTDEAVYLGDHVWVCSNVNIIKGACIQSNCVVSCQTLIREKFQENDCIIAGNPARIVKRGIVWNL